MRCRSNHQASPNSLNNWSHIATNKRTTNKGSILMSTNHRRARRQGSQSKTNQSIHNKEQLPSKSAACFKPRCRKLTRLPRTELMGYIDRAVYSAEAPTPPATGKLRLTNSLSKTRPTLKRSWSLERGKEDLQLYYDAADEQETEEYYRQRSNSLPSVWDKPDKSEQDQTMNERKILAIMLNLAHIIVGIAITQLGIVGAWYQRYMNFQEDQLRHVLYICVLFIVTGSYGMFVIMKRVSLMKAHRTAYTVLSSLSIIASCFIIANGVRLVLADTYQTHELVIVIFDGLLVGLSVLEIPVALVSIYKTVPDPGKYLQRQLSNNELFEYDDDMLSEKDKPPPSWGSICSMILNVAHIVLGLCIIELGMVGMLYRRFMNIDGTGLFAIVFTSLSFITVGMIGIYNQLTGKAAISCNRFMYMGASLLAVGCASTIMSFISVAMSSKQYYAGIEAIVAFDVMILSMSGMELVVGLVATALCLVPLCLSKLRDNISPISS